MRNLNGTYSSDFDRMFTNRIIQLKPVSPRAPILNAFAARWIQGLKHEALNNFMMLDLARFDYIFNEYVAYYLERRPNQRIGNRLIAADKDEEPLPVVTIDQVKREARLGGLL